MDLPTVDCDDRKQANKLVYTLNKMNLKLRDGQTLLHLAVNGVTPVDDFHTSDVCRFPCVETVKLLLECGAPVSVMDCSRNSPLHTLTATVRIQMKWTNRDLMLDRSNNFKFTRVSLSLSPPLNSCSRLERQIRTSILIILKKLHICSSRPASTWTLLMLKVLQPHKYVHHVSLSIPTSPTVYHCVPASGLSSCRWSVFRTRRLLLGRWLIRTQWFSLIFILFLILSWARCYNVFHLPPQAVPIQAMLRRYECHETCLKCLASRCIAQHKIAYKDVVPKQLETYIQLHSAEKLWRKRRRLSMA